MFPLQKWRRDLSKLDIRSQERPAAPLPAVVGEWFDINREVLADAMSHDIGTAKLKALGDRVRASGWDPDWVTGLMHGWSVRIARYTRVAVVPTPAPNSRAISSIHVLLMIARGPTAPKAKDWDMRDDIVERLGGDVDEDLLMETGPDDEPKLITFWTWAV